MSKLYNPKAIINALFEEGTEVSAITVQVLSTGDTFTFEHVTTKSLVGDDDSTGQYAMVEGTLKNQNETKGLKISTKRSENGDIIDIYVSGNVANPHLFDKEQTVLTNLTE